MDKTLRQRFPRKTMGVFGNYLRARLRHPSYQMQLDKRYERFEELGRTLPVVPVTVFPVTKVEQPAASSSKLPKA